MYHKVGGSTKHQTSSFHAPPTAPAHSITPLGPRANERSNGNQSGYGSSERYPRERSRERRRDVAPRADVIDGSFGFDDRMEMDADNGEETRPNLYSDTLVNKRGRGHNRGQGYGYR